MLTDPYATASEYRAHIDKSDPGSDVEIEIGLAAMSRYLDRKLNRFFNRDDAPVERSYCGGLTPWLETADMSEEPSAVSLDGDALEATSFWTWPRNALLMPEPSPYRGLYTGSAYTYRLIHITCRWGWPQVPPGIKLATIELTALWRLETPRATQRVNELQESLGTSELANRIVADLMRQYSRPMFVIA